MGETRFGVAIRTLGCRVNRADSDAMSEALARIGIPLVASEEQAQVVIINTCTVTGEADHKGRKAVRHALAAGGASGQEGPIVVVTGCMAAVDAEAVARLGERVVVEPRKDLVAECVARLLPSIATAAAAPASDAPTPAPRARIALKVQDGCDCRCAYCIVPDARGTSRSVSLAEVVARVHGLAESGISEVVIAGVNLGTYRDDAASAHLAELVRAVAATGIPRIRLSSIEPQHLDDHLLATLAQTEAFCPHLHVPLQSGSDPVLASMRRTYTAEEYADIVARARRALGALAITTDVMVGFPGEADGDFQATCALCEQIGFAKLHVFRYSPRAGTPAASMSGAVPAPVSATRAERLRALGDDLRAAYIADRKGGDAMLLVEGIDSERGIAYGTTEDYLKLEMELADTSTGRIIPVTLSDSSVCTVE